jgi:hypothetical protein
MIEPHHSCPPPLRSTALVPDHCAGGGDGGAARCVAGSRPLDFGLPSAVTAGCFLAGPPLTQRPMDRDSPPQLPACSSHAVSQHATVQSDRTRCKRLPGARCRRSLRRRPRVARVARKSRPCGASALHRCARLWLRRCARGCVCVVPSRRRIASCAHPDADACLPRWRSAQARVDGLGTGANAHRPPRHVRPSD